MLLRVTVIQIIPNEMKMANTSIPSTDLKIRSINHPNKLWRWLVEPAASVTRPDERRQARLVSTIQLTIFCLNIISAIYLGDKYAGVSGMLWVAGILIALVYGLSRTRFFKLAAGLFILLEMGIPFAAAIEVGSLNLENVSNLIIWSTLSVLLGSMFFRFPVILAQVGVILAAIFGIVIPRSSLELGSLVSPLLFLVFLAALIIVAARFRDGLEKDRLLELSTANLALESMRNRLEELVTERTHELMEATETIQQEHEQLLESEKLASLGRLTGGFAHEINTPLAASRAALTEINRLVEEYQESIGDEEVTPDDHREIGDDLRRSLRLAEGGMEKIAGFVRSIKSQIRDVIPRDKIRFKAVPVIRDSLLLVNHALKKSNCTASFEVESEDMELYGLPGQLSQVVTNLVSNAIDATGSKGGIIQLSLTRQPEGIEMLVSDQGSGMPPDVLSRIFDLFFTTKPSGVGTGLGLKIVRDIVVDAFGGTIDVTSRPEWGTTFTLQFPNPGDQKNGS
jgi:signal transduction histidine kinase